MLVHLCVCVHVCVCVCVCVYECVSVLDLVVGFSVDGRDLAHTPQDLLGRCCQQVSYSGVSKPHNIRTHLEEREREGG